MLLLSLSFPDRWTPLDFSFAFPPLFKVFRPFDPFNPKLYIVRYLHSLSVAVIATCFIILLFAAAALSTPITNPKLNKEKGTVISYDSDALVVCLCVATTMAFNATLVYSRVVQSNSNTIPTVYISCIDRTAAGRKKKKKASRTIPPRARLISKRRVKDLTRIDGRQMREGVASSLVVPLSAF